MNESFYHRHAKDSTSLLPLRRSAFGLILLLCLAACSSVPQKQQEPDRQPEIPYGQIRQSIEAGDPQNALREYLDFLEAFPGLPTDRLLLARLLLAAGYPEKARDQLALLIEESSATKEALLTLGLAEKRAGNPEQARQYLERALELEDGDPEVLAALGALQLDAEEYEQAEVSFRDALKADPSEPTALRGLAVLYLSQGQYQQSIRLLDRAIEADPRNSLNYADRARAKAALKDRRAAVQDLSAAIELDPDFYWHYIDRGRHYLRLRLWEEAEDDFSRAIEIDSELFLAYVYRAGLYDHLDRITEAIADYERILELNPQYIFAHAPLAVLQYLRKNWPSAAEQFQRAYIHEPEEPSYALLAGLSWMQLGEREKAAAYLRRQLEDFSPESWAAVIARYLIDPALELRTINRANAEQNRLTRARMLFFIASRLLMEDRVETALRYLLLVTEAERRDLPEKRIAEVVLHAYGYKD
jgi:tetratricopeptide (TPR) repeat protein